MKAMRDVFFRNSHQVDSRHNMVTKHFNSDPHFRRRSIYPTLPPLVWFLHHYIFVAYPVALVVGFALHRWYWRITSVRIGFVACLSLTVGHAQCTSAYSNLEE